MLQSNTHVNFYDFLMISYAFCMYIFCIVCTFLYFLVTVICMIISTLVSASGLVPDS